MDRRHELNAIFEALLGTDQVYFQPPENVKMGYPAIVYERDYRSTQYADNIPYAVKKRYMVTIIDRNPDSEFPDKVAALPFSVFSRHYVVQGLHHDVYSLYY